MSIRLKLILFMLAFLCVSVILGGGLAHIFGSLNENLSLLEGVTKRHGSHMTLKDSLTDYLMVAKGYALTGEMKTRKKYNEKLSAVYKGFGDLERDKEYEKDIEKIGEKFQEIKELAGQIIGYEHPVGSPGTIYILRKIEEKQGEMFSLIDDLSDRSNQSIIGVVEEGKRIRRKMSFSLYLLVAFSTLSFAFLLLFMRRMLGEPFRELLNATERVSSGDMGYRIASSKKDEFGVIASRFDGMIDSLEESNRKIKEKLRETEILLNVARIAGATPEFKEALDLIVKTIAEELGKDLCAVFLLRPERGDFCLVACNAPDMEREKCISLDLDISKEIMGSLKPIIINDVSERPEAGEICEGAKSFLIVPIQRESSCIGIVVLGNRTVMGFREAEKDMGLILAHTIGAVCRNTELFMATRGQLKQLSVIYDLSRRIAAVYEPDELLRKIASEIAKLINARGCVIRIVEGDTLKVKSHYGMKETYAGAMDLPVDKGIPGWVVREGRAIFVEDIEEMPEDMRVPGFDAKSAICVPLKVGDRIIGTLGLYDKIGPDGRQASFTHEDLGMAEGFASISAVAISKARLVEEEHKREAEILEGKKRMDLLFDSVQGGIVTVDRGYRVISANRYVERWIDVPLGEIIGGDAMKLFHEKGGICPHCVAKATFETGSVNTITQSSGLNYAELSSYPLRDESGGVREAVVFIQDITDRVLYQEEIMSLYREVTQTKDYLESLINNSADAIVTSDMKGIITSWNNGAARIYGFGEAEAVGAFLPFVPDFLYETEAQNIEKIKRGEVLKDIETMRKRKDGKLIEVSLTLSPIKDGAGELMGISGISRDISERKRVEKELIRRNQELSRLFFISSAMRGTLELDRLLRMVLTAVTMSDGLGFNRAMLFLVDEERGVAKGAMGVGPKDIEEAWKVWDDLSVSKKSLDEMMIEMEKGPLRKDSFLDKLSMGMEIALGEETVLSRSVREKMAINVPDIKTEPSSDAVLIQQLGTEAYAVIPLISRGRVIGVLWVDNIFNKRPITEEDMNFLSGFSNQVASAIENARLFQQVSLAEAELENIFSSISDMVYFTDGEYTLRKVNQAVCEKMGMRPEEIIGKKCYKVFHGLEEPLQTCPHHRTVKTMQAAIEEYDDEHMNGAFLSSTSPIFDNSGAFLGTVHVVRDVTEHKELRERLKSSEKMAALGEVAARVAHEIRNPLVSIGGFAGRLEGKLDGNLKEYASIISREVGRLEKILREILGFVREARLAKKSARLDEIVEGIEELLSSEIAEKQNAVVKELNPVSASIDPERVKEAILNIVTNANQATDGGTVTLRTYQDGGSSVVEVSDTGCGIKPEDIKDIFNPFFTTRPTGTGLGLAISKRIVEEHKGKITVESTRGEGTTFRIYLPIKEG